MTKFVAIIVITLLASVIVVLVLLASDNKQQPPWTDTELATIQSLWLDNLPPLPPNPSNAVADNPNAAVFGQHLFFDTRFSKNGKVSCATCHQPERYFTDGLPLAEGVAVGTRNTQSVVGLAYSPWFFWDGRKDSLWSQALAPLENEVEHGGNRQQYAQIIADDADYRIMYQRVFGQLPAVNNDEAVNRVFVNMGKSLEAYQRLMVPGESRFDHYVDYLVNGREYSGDELLSEQEIHGLRLFIGKAQCINCHNGPLFTNFSFHNTGIFPRAGGTPDLGRVEGATLVKEDPFNCLGNYSDDADQRCDELHYMKEGDELIGAQKTPSLRTLIGTEPFMHAGQFTTLAEVLEHYNTADGALIGHNEAKPLNLSARDLQALEAFLRSLTAPIAVEENWLQAPSGMTEGDAVTQLGSAY